MRVGNWLNIISIVWYNTLGLFCLSRSTCESEIARNVTFIHGCVCLINGFCVFLGLANLDTIIMNSREIGYLRYVEWTLCTPMMTYEMCVASRITAWETKTIVALTVAFCLCGSIAAVIEHEWAKIVLGVKGTLYCLIVLYRIGRSGFSVAPRDFMHRAGYYNFIVAVTVWPLFVLTWGLGPDVYSIISVHDEIFAQRIFSIILKSCAVLYSISTYNIDIETFEEIIIELASNGIEGPSLISI
jgi:bacteriorhodopsin